MECVEPLVSVDLKNMYFAYSYIVSGAVRALSLALCVISLKGWEPKTDDAETDL
jgi:hypothetical protein